MSENEAIENLNIKIEQMNAPESNISYVAIVQKGNNQEDFGVEYGEFNEKGDIEFSKQYLGEQKNNFPGFEMIEKDSTIKIGFDPKSSNKKTTLTRNGLLLNTKIKEKIRPLKAGISLADFTSSVKSGTLGGLFQVHGNKNIYGISNMHVVSYFKEKGRRIKPTKHQELVVQPSRDDGADFDYDPANTIIGRTVWKRFDGIIDAAIIRVHDNLTYRSGFFNGERKIRIKTSFGKAKIGEETFKYGRTSGYSTGRILSTKAAIRINNPYHHLEGEKEYLVFTDQIMTENMAKPGDSGSLLVRGNGQPIGLTFAHISILNSKLLSASSSSTDLGRTFHNKLELVFKSLSDSKDTYDAEPFLNFKQFLT